ncbi:MULTISPECIES: hypothetical protein [Mesorhizobium]|uniref:hypothetical protein n=1 Tax=Mesorhizobium TaxID=68287 RepID=UPI0007A956BA|nr:MULTISPECIES: hypothetical protein [Mesorhizobium]AMX93744.1 hypothetical protein A4R28_11830 [Mesorhizobium ciceri]MDF3208445.1 hypothetical protein [Mesorhizobium sp. LMG15046]MDF3228984.1 hypothetical protein [Mesorhizobium sp. DSM 30133]
MEPMVALRTEPDDFQRFGVISVMSVNLIVSAKFARLFEESAVAHRIANGGLRLIGNRVLFSPSHRYFPRLGFPVWALGTIAIIFLHRRVCSCALSHAALDTLFAGAVFVVEIIDDLILGTVPADH